MNATVLSVNNILFLLWGFLLGYWLQTILIRRRITSSLAAWEPQRCVGCAQCVLTQHVWECQWWEAPVNRDIDGCNRWEKKVSA